MKKIISKLGYLTFDIIAFMFSAVLIWLIISTVEISFNNHQAIKENKFNLFVFSQRQKDIDIIADDDFEDEEQIISC